MPWGKLVSRQENGVETRFEYLYTLGASPLAGERVGTEWRRFYVWSPEGLLLLHDRCAAETTCTSITQTRWAQGAHALTNDAGEITDTYAYDPLRLVDQASGENGSPSRTWGPWGAP
jgi:hypothetical protein